MPATTEDSGDGALSPVPGVSSILTVERVTKSFFDTFALREVSLEIAFGEIHALLGENGAGKSTLIKILAGVYQRDSGRVAIAGEEMPQRITPAHIAGLGVAFIHQDLALVVDASIAENIAIVTGYPKRRGLVSLNRMNADAAARLEAVGSHLDPRVAVDELNSADRALVAIARALVHGARLVVLDEPTARLRGPEVEHLFEQLRRLKRNGASFLYVTHRLEEVFELADRATVIRDGRTVATHPMSQVSQPDLIGDIIGRKLGEVFPELPDDTAQTAEPVLQMRDVTTPHIERVSLEVRPGEVVGLAGLVSRAPSSIARAAFGVEEILGGEVRVCGQVIKPGRFPSAVERVAYVPADRHREGLALDLSTRENLLLVETVLASRRRRRLVPPWLPRGEASRARQLISDFDVRPPDPEFPIATLSGGNQQKVLLAKWIATNPRLLILEEPTAGVDIGTKAEIYRIIAELAERGTGILLISSDFEEVAELSHRALIIRGGRIGLELDRDSLSRERIAAESYKAA